MLIITNPILNSMHDNFKYTSNDEIDKIRYYLKIIEIKH